MTSVSVFGVRIDNVTALEMRTAFVSWLDGGAARFVVTPNPEFLLLAQRDHTFRMILNRADLALPDGVGLRFAVSALTDERLTERMTGVDTLDHLARECASMRRRLLLLGGADDLAELAAATLRGKHPHLDCVALNPGCVDGEGQLSMAVVERVRNIAPAVIAVALGHGKQERCIARNIASWPSVRIAIGVGGAFDTISSKRPRAPEPLRRAGLEWLWRLCIEPRRFARIFLAFIVFPAVVVWATLRERRFLRACRRTIPEIFDQLFSSRSS